MKKRRKGRTGLRLSAFRLGLVMVFLAAAGAMSADEVVLPAAQCDGYAIDETGDEHGDIKISGYKVQDLSVGEIDDAKEARAWIPFVLTEDQKALVRQAGMSVTLRLFLTGRTDTAGQRVDIHGAGYRSAYRVNQSDYATLRKKIVPNAFNENSVAPGVLEFDVTRFVLEEASRPDAAGAAFGFVLQIHDENVLPKADGSASVFKIASTGRADPALHPALIIAARPPVSNPPDPAPPDPNALRVLIIGNSILKNGPLPDLGWYGNWGMAASGEPKDFAHLLMARIRAAVGRPVEFMLHNMASWESSWSTTRHDIPSVTFPRDFRPHVIVSCISENTGLLDNQVAPYKQKYAEMIAIIAGGSSGTARADVVVRGSFWTINGNTDLALSQAAAENGWPYVACSDLGTRPRQAWEADYLDASKTDPSVLNHPGDAGMQAIADRIWDGALGALLTTKYAKVPTPPRAPGNGLEAGGKNP